MYNRDRRGRSRLDSGAPYFPGRFTVPLARLSEACLSRNTSELSHGTGELPRLKEVRRLPGTSLC